MSRRFHLFVVVMLALVLCGTSGCASRQSAARAALNVGSTRASSALSRPGTRDPADKVRDAVRSLREGLARKNRTPDTPPDAASSLGTGTSTPNPSGTSGSWSSVVVPPPARTPPAEPSVRSRLSMATQQLVRGSAGWGIVMLILVIAAAMLLVWMLAARRQPRA